MIQTDHIPQKRGKVLVGIPLKIEISSTYIFEFVLKTSQN